MACPVPGYLPFKKLQLLARPSLTRLVRLPATSLGDMPTAALAMERCADSLSTPRRRAAILALAAATCLCCPCASAAVNLSAGATVTAAAGHTRTINIHSTAPAGIGHADRHAGRPNDPSRGTARAGASRHAAGAAVFSQARLSFTASASERRVLWVSNASDGAPRNTCRSRGRRAQSRAYDKGLPSLPSNIARVYPPSLLI